MPSKDAMTSKDGTGGGRRKSMSFLSIASFSGLPFIDTNISKRGEESEDNEKKEKKKSSKRNSIFTIGHLSGLDFGSDGQTSPVKNGGSSSPRIGSRPRTLQKGRPTSIFGSLGRRSINNTEEGDSDNLACSPDTPPNEEGHSSGSFSRAVLYHGEVQTTSGMFRKKKEYLVLTDTHLVRFKSQSRASEIFPSIHVVGRSNNTRHPSTTSIGSFQEVQSLGSHASAEHDNRISLGQIVTAYKVEDGRPFFTTEVVHLDEDCHGVGALQLILHDPKEADLWLTSIRGAAEKARLLMAIPYPERVIRYLASALEDIADYSVDHFQVFRVVRRAATPRGSRSSADDLQKFGSSVFYMVIGINRVHLIPIPDFNSSNGKLVAPKASRIMHGIVSLTDLKVVNDDDRFELAFRTPLQGSDVLELAASGSQDIAVGIVRAWQHLKPLWEDFNFNFNCPKRLIQMCDSTTPTFDDEIGCFDRTLVAYCLAYKCNPDNIQYAVDYDVEDAPEFTLWPPRYSKGYKLTELLSVMRALRYNETFRSVSFRDIDLHPLHGWIESSGSEHVATTTRGGLSLHKYFNIESTKKSVLYQEVQALALKSIRLRRMDFTNTLPRRRPKDTFDIEGGDVDKDPGSEIVAALLPLCQRQLTNVSWISLSGIELGETDLDFLIPALNNPDSGIRAIECARCGLNDRGIMVMVTHLARQNASIECVDISDNPGRIQLEQFQTFVSRFTRIRKLNLSKTLWTKGSVSMFLPEVISTWQLEELILNGVMVNEKTLGVISTYLASNASRYLGILQMDQCSLDGSQVANLMHAMTTHETEARDLEFHVSGNRLEKGVSEIVDAIKANHAPTRLYLQMIEFTKEDYFRQLLEALRTNTTIRVLDISKASLPYDAGEETCEALRSLFSDNHILQELDISGEQAHLEVTRFGIGLNHALTGLKLNNTLRILRIEYQNLGLEGANTLSSVIEENRGLTHIYCEHNDINLQGFTTIVNALATNHNILVLPFCKDDQTVSMKRMDANMRDTRLGTRTGSKNERTMKSTVRRTLYSFGVSSKSPKQEVTAQDVDAVVKLLNDRWDHEVGRLAQFLSRNNNSAAGIPIPEEDIISEDTMRPTTVLSDQGILEHVLSNTTPKAELNNPVDNHATATRMATPRIEISNPTDEYVVQTQGPEEATSGNEHFVFQGKENLGTINRPVTKGHIPTATIPQFDSHPLLDFQLPVVRSEKLFDAAEENVLFMMES